MSAEIKFNPAFNRWEVYGDKPVVRAGEPQPEYVSGSFEKCATYKAATMKGAGDTHD